jgi:hypothetical protein
MGDVSAQGLLQELTGADPQLRQFLVANPRFQGPDFLELLLEESRDAQLICPETGAKLARLAIGIAERIRDNPDMSRSVLVRAHCLSANALRLSNLAGLAEEELRSTAELLDPMPRYDEELRALYCRTVALLHWEEGRLDEALSLLRQARRLFQEAHATVEWQTCSFLLALLFDEMGLPQGVVESIGPFLGDWLDPASRPWLKSRAMFTLAAALVSVHERRPICLFALEEGVRFRGHVSDPDEQHRLFALEGRALARLECFDDAEQMIEAVRRHYLEERKIFELTLSSLDLLALRDAAGRPPGIDALLADIESLQNDPLSCFELASAALDRFVSWVGGGEDPWTSQRVAATWYLQAYRFHGVEQAPFPFA